MSSRLTVLAVLATLAVTFGCAQGPSRHERVGEFTRLIDAGSATSLVIEGTVGSIELRPSEVSTVEVAVAALYRGGREALGRDAGPDDVLVKVDGDAVLVQNAHPDDAVDGNWRLDLKIAVPSDLDVRVRNQVGDCSIEGTRGSLYVELGVGTIRVSTPGSDQVSLKTCVGDVELRITGVPSTGRIRCESDFGDVTLRLPRGSEGSVSLRSDVGGVRTSGASGLNVYRSVTYSTAEGTLGDLPSTVTARTRIGNVELVLE
jgi:hypothetical protein